MWLLDSLKDAQLYLQLRKCEFIHRATVDRCRKTHFNMPVVAAQMDTTLWRVHFSDSVVEY